MVKNRLISAVIAAAMAVSTIAVPSVSAEEDYGIVTNNADGSITLNFGENSITTSGGGEIIVHEGAVKRPDNLKSDGSNIAVLTMPSVSLKGTDYDKVDLLVSSKNDASVSVKVGGTEIAAFENVNNGAWDNYSAPLTANLMTTEAEGNVTLNITGPKAKTYCGNYVYVRLYKSGGSSTVNPTSKPENNTPAPTSRPDESQDTLPYLDTSLSFEERAADLVSRMTLEEKVSQIGYKAAAVERLGIKAYDYWKEALHGVARQGKATSFPTALSLSNTWNRDLIHKAADIISTEARGKNNRYNLSYWSPTINMARDPRWGRNEETYGEDPYLTGQLGAAFVSGMQGDDDKYLKTIATLKHFAANNNEQNRSGGSSMMNEYNFRNYYLKVFQNVTEEVMPASVMSSYNATTITRNGENIYNFVPSLSNSYILQDMLRRNWGFDGYVTSDCGAGEYMSRSSAFKNGMLGNDTSETEAYVAEFFKNGLNVECNLSGGNWSTNYGVSAVEKGYLSEEELERAVYELFLQRMRTGEFDDGAAYQNINSAVIETDEHIAVAEEAAEESWVLLKNDNILPLNENSAKNVVVVGNMANALLLGDYTGTPTKLTYPIDGIREHLKTLNKDAQITYLGAARDDEKLFNIKSITLVFANGSTKKLDLSQAQNVSGMTLSNGVFTDVTPKASAVIKNVNFQNVVKVQAEISTGTYAGGTLDIAYGEGGPGVASISSKATSGTDEYAVCEGDYTGADGGYNGTVDMYISAGAAAEFSIENNKAELDAADVIIAYAGTIPKQTTFGVSGESDSSESRDRKNIDLPAHQSHVADICGAYPEKTVVVMSTVGQINVEPFMDKCKAILWTSYNGQTQGDALGKVLTGEVNPSGKLTTTWYENADVSKMELYNSTQQTVDGIKGNYTDYNLQSDGTNPGHTYQYYTGTPVYPFGYGLSYTSFEYSNITADKTTVDANGTLTLSADVTNTGNTAGKETVQLYISHPQTGDSLIPAKQLKGFEKISLNAGETKKVSFTLNVRDMYLFSEKEQKDIVPEGEYTAYIAKNSSDTAMSAKFTVTGTLESTLKTVKAIPNGVSLNGLICEDGTGLTSLTTIDTNLSAIMSDEVWVDLTDAESGTEVALASDNDGLTASMKYENGNLIINSSKNQSAVIIYASYENGNLSKIRTENKTLAEGSNTVSGANVSEGDTVLLWNSLRGMQPIAEELVIEKTDEPTPAPTPAATEKPVNEKRVVYTSSNEAVATVDADGIVRSGAKEGIATITAAVTVNGVTKTASYPVVNKLQTKPTDAEIAAAKAELKAAYDNLPKSAYSADNLAEIEKIYTAADAALSNAQTKPEMENTLAVAINDLKSVPLDNLRDGYSIESVNPKHIEKGVIDYREGGIPMYSGNTGTVTVENPYSPIALKAVDSEGNAVDASKLIWQVQKFDNSVRRVADIDADGNLTVYGNGVIQITAANLADMTCGKLMVHVNMQIEGEYADNANGADLNDAQKNTSGGKDAGSTGDAWIEYKSVKLSNLGEILVRYAGKKAGAVNVSLDKSAAADKVIASATLPATDGWASWAEAQLKLNDDVIADAQLNGLLDKYGCATVYIQTNGINLDYFRMNYIENNDEIPYVIEKVLNKADGMAKITLKYRGSTLASDVTLKAEVLNEDLSVKTVKTITVNGAGEYETATGAQDGETVRYTVCDAQGNALCEPFEKVYNTPVDSEIVVYSLDSKDFDYTVLTGGTDGVAYTATVNGLSGYGAFVNVNKSAEYTYTDVNEKEHSYSFKKAWQSGSGGTKKRCLYFTPKAPCRVTAVFTGGEAARSMTVFQSNDNMFTQPGTGSVAAASIEVSDITQPVYVYGGSSNKQLYAVIVEYYGAAEEAAALSTTDYDRPVQFAEWGGSRAVLTKNEMTDESKVWLLAQNGLKTQLGTDYFYESDLNEIPKLQINTIAAYKNRLYAGCDDGLVIVFTECVKCYKLKKAWEYDIKSMEIADGIMTVSDGENSAKIDMGELGGDIIERDEADVLIANGAVLVDVRSEEEYAQGSADGAVNIPLDKLEQGLGAYATDTAIIFVCGTGARSSSAVAEAERLGYTNVYNGGKVNIF